MRTIDTMSSHTTHISQDVRIPEVRTFLDKIVVNAGVGRASQTPNFEEKALVQIKKDLAAIVGQAPQVRTAKKSIAGFKVREGQVVGLRITLRDKKMVDFFERLIRIVLPRVRDFNGLAEGSIDDHGSLQIGFKEQFAFPEIHPEESLLSFSLGVTIVPKRARRARAVEWYHKMGVPLK